MASEIKFCDSLFEYRRRKTRVVQIADVAVGGDNPIRVQSMTISDTMNTKATVEEVIQLVEVGCEIVRITAPSINEAENLKNIKTDLSKHGIHVPLVADIHFTPNAALVAANYVEKVRINPGNYADRKRFEQYEYTDAEYQQELERIDEKFKPLVAKCKSLGRAIRIGTNHGSLSDRIMNRYGDTPEGMVESALEFVRICEKYDYHEIILSMKSSNPLVAIQAYRLLAARMDELGMDYPFHLGVTEAGDGEEGRIKSAVGIGSLLEDGIGDTIRVSLTEDSVAEVPVAFKLVEKYNNLKKNKTIQNISKNGNHLRIPNPFEYERRQTLTCDQIYYKLSGDDLPRVELSLSTSLSDTPAALGEISEFLGKKSNDPLQIVSGANGTQTFECETIHVSVQSHEELKQFAKLKNRAFKRELWLPFAVDFSQIPELAFEVAKSAERLVFSPNSNADLTEVVSAAKMFGMPVEWKIKPANFASIDKALNLILNICKEFDYWNILFSLSGYHNNVRNYRYLAGRLDAMEANFAMLLRYSTDTDLESTILDASSQLGSLLCDGIGDSIHIDANLPADDLLRLSYNILQATRVRISKTDYISCPSCGRTLFNLQTTTERIKSKTDHLKGVKIAIMGCIVNGPGEMADADFGYVGAGPEKVNLFVGKECVERNIPEEKADDRLIELIKSHGKWLEL